MVPCHAMSYLCVSFAMSHRFSAVIHKEAIQDNVWTGNTRNRHRFPRIKGHARGTLHSIQSAADVMCSHTVHLQDTHMVRQAN